MLPFIYPGKDINKLLADITSADIPEVHKKMYSWIRAFTMDSSSLTKDDIENLIQAGVTATDISEWVNVASTQTWFVMSADGGGIPLENNDVVGSVVGIEREQYHKHNVQMAGTRNSKAVMPQTGDEISWLPEERNNTKDQEESVAVTQWAEKAFGFVPNLFKATSHSPYYFPRHQLAIELLSAPQSSSLTPRLHSLVRRVANKLNGGSYFDQTTRELVAAHDPALIAPLDDIVDQGTGFAGMESSDKVVLEFTQKLVRNAYKVTEKDAQQFRDCGLDDEAYVDVLNTVSIQTSLDRLCNSLGIRPDGKALLTSTG